MHNILVILHPYEICTLFPPLDVAIVLLWLNMLLFRKFFGWGPDLSTADEWFELTSNYSGSLSLSGWSVWTVKGGEEKHMLTIEDDLQLHSKSSVVIANYHADRSRLARDADYVTTSVRLPNTKLQLVLKDASGSIIDIVDDSVGAPMAGEKSSKLGIRKSMERTSFYTDGTKQSSWITATISSEMDDEPRHLATPWSVAESFFNQQIITLPSQKVVTTTQEECSPNKDLKITITEFLANPKGSDRYNEWIELYLDDVKPRQLCGWYLDDVADRGSKPFSLHYTVLRPGYNTLYRRTTGLALNNSNETIRLLFGEEAVIDSVSYTVTTEDRSLAKRQDGTWLPSLQSTPGQQNLFRTAGRSYTPESALLTAVMPNPVGTDVHQEYVTIKNTTSSLLSLRDWRVATSLYDTGEPFSDTVLKPGQSVTVTLKSSTLTLRNKGGLLVLKDPDGYVQSSLEWGTAKEGVAMVQTGNTIRIAANIHSITASGVLYSIVEQSDTWLLSVPPEVRTAYYSKWKNGGSLSASLFGLDSFTALEGMTSFPSLRESIDNVVQENVPVHLLLRWNNQGEPEAIIEFDNGQWLQTALLQSGLAIAGQYSFFRQLEKEAQWYQLGIWRNAQQTLTVQEWREDQLFHADLQKKPLNITAERMPKTAEKSAQIQLVVNHNVTLYYSTGNKYVFSIP